MFQAEDGIRDVAVTGVQMCSPSRRRHTRCSRDWSSDVCSSDLFMLGDKARSPISTNWLIAYKVSCNDVLSWPITKALSSEIELGIPELL